MAATAKALTPSACARSRRATSSKAGHRAGAQRARAEGQFTSYPGKAQPFEALAQGAKSKLSLAPFRLPLHSAPKPAARCSSKDPSNATGRICDPRKVSGESKCHMRMHRKTRFIHLFSGLRDSERNGAWTHAYHRGQLLGVINRRQFQAIIDRHNGDSYVKCFTSREHLVALVYAQSGPVSDCAGWQPTARSASKAKGYLFVARNSSKSSKCWPHQLDHKQAAAHEPVGPGSSWRNSGSFRMWLNRISSSAKNRSPRSFLTMLPPE